MSIKEILKNVDWLRRIVKKVKIYYEYLQDANCYSKYYLESAERYGDERYRVLLLVHNLEKGMCRKDLRPFGFEKAQKLVKILSNSFSDDCFEYRLGKSVLYSWKELMCRKGWGDKIPVDIVEYLDNNKCPDVNTGTELYFSKELSENCTFSDVVFSRRSVRSYLNKPLSDEDVMYAVKCFLSAPTACNRQMCRIYYVKDKDIKHILHNTLLGSGGIDFATVSYFVITYDISSLEFFGERNQGYLNAGLVSMNFVNGLHARGIGTCCLQWANKRREDKMMCNRLHLNNSERIALVIAAGYYSNGIEIPHSQKRSVSEVLSII